MYSENALAMILMCSRIGVVEDNYKPYTDLKWSQLANKIRNSKFKD